MGLWQAVALIPGTSRSGITITAGRMLGYDRESAARLAMLMSIPTILASGAFWGARSSRPPTRRPRATVPSPRPWPSSPRSRR
jgi:undecaprenyl pyrophosphate phosphatase UppP